MPNAPDCAKQARIARRANMNKRDFVGGLAGATVLALLGVGTAEAQVIVRVAPPPPREEPAPPPRRGMVWVAGRWDWNGRRYVWRKGHWMRARRGHRYVQDEWVERNGRWELRRGRWARGDADGDGVPNRVDPAPNNPRR
jgi:hypothetical protein